MRVTDLESESNNINNYTKIFQNKVCNNSQFLLGLSPGFSSSKKVDLR